MEQAHKHNEQPQTNSQDNDTSNVLAVAEEVVTSDTVDVLPHQRTVSPEDEQAIPYEPGLADDLVSQRTSPEQFPGTEYEDADYDEEETDNLDIDDSWPIPRKVMISKPRLKDTPRKELGRDKPLPKGRFADRELSWMQFNERVLEQAEDTDVPLLERAWFTTIFTSNLDEFYMVRVAGLKRRIAAGIAKTAASGLTPRQVMDGISDRCRELCTRQAELVQDDILPKLEEEGIYVQRWDALSKEEHDKMHGYFRRQIFPVLTPFAVDPSHPFPYISGLSLNLAVVVQNPLTGKQHFARVKVPSSLPRMVSVDMALRGIKPEEALDIFEKAVFIPIEDIITAHLDHLFPGMEILEHHSFRVTRNEDLEVEEDDAENLLTAMEEELLRRRFGPAVRLEVSQEISKFVLDFLVSKLGITYDDVFRLPEPLDLTCLNDLHDLDLPHLKYKNFVPATPQGLSEVESATPTDIFAAIRQHDILLHHPYDSFSTSVQHFISTASKDPKVVAIKQTLYRTSSDSPIVSALIEAAQAGKEVVAIVEIKARFDEDANIAWARKLERAGVHVVYGMVGLKTHCKLSMVVRQDDDALRRYCHVGTGNYHPKTARGYEDLGLLTVDREVGQDLSRLFNQLSGYAPLTTFHRLLVAPRSIRPGLLERIEREINNHKEGKKSYIGLKVNSLVDEDITDALYRASQEGVPVDIVVRGICALRGGVPGLSDNIRVRSILGRYLEHSRIYAFENGGEHEVWIGSADLMHRNLDRRVEALIRLRDRDMVERLFSMVKRQASSTTSSWHQLKSGLWKRHKTDADGKRLDDIQQLLMDQANARMTGR
ncbi:MAG: RNA degradosome polyphosphate kinase [Actinomycetaceae bacterium]|nr:RNA degradosome polyphosphate kinase [Actinomycetaceae bacterium]